MNPQIYINRLYTQLELYERKALEEEHMILNCVTNEEVIEHTKSLKLINNKIINLKNSLFERGYGN